MHTSLSKYTKAVNQPDMPGIGCRYVNTEGSLSSSCKWRAKKMYNVTIVFLFVLANLQNAISSKPGKQQQKVNHKYILVWTPVNTFPFSHWSFGDNEFIKRKCPVTNCYITYRTDFFGGDITKFDALIFNGRNLGYYKRSHLPNNRSNHQKYIFTNMESSDNQPICDPIFDDFFNWTETYKLNSDIVFSYFLIRNMAGEVVGPKINMTWTDQISEVNDTVVHNLGTKSKAATWFVSKCGTRGRREMYAADLKKSLEVYNLALDIYGGCGQRKCPKSEERKCQILLKNDYFFYLSFENSFAEDYITEKVLTPLRNDAVPILYGGADYSRFLPPGSYLDAMKYTPYELATIMAYLMKTPAEYRKFFLWRTQYSYEWSNNICKLCSALNDQTKIDSQTMYRNFREWWNPDYVKRCKDKNWNW